MISELPYGRVENFNPSQVLLGGAFFFFFAKFCTVATKVFRKFWKFWFLSVN